MFKYFMIIICSLVFINISCDQASNDTENVIATGIKQALTENKLQLDKIVPFQWDTLYVFKPYTTIEEINNTIGPNFKEAAKSGISYSDNFCLLVFKRNNQVCESVVLHRKYGDFSYIKKGIYTPNSAIFKIKVQSQGSNSGADWYYIYDYAE